MCAAILLVHSVFVFAQQPVPQPNPPLAAGVLGPPLVAWSELQKPRPVPQPLPPPRPDPPAEQPSQQQPGGSQAQQQPSSQVFTGTIVKEGSKYVLKTDSTSYQIDDQEKAKMYEGKQVKIAGSLDTKTNVLHVTSIELLP